MSDADAVRARYIEALSRRMQTAPEAVQRVLQGKLQQAMARCGASETDAEAAIEPPRKRAGTRPRKPVTPLGQLNQHIATTTGLPAGASTELKSARAFRETWSRICAEDEVVQAVQRGPDNAGPLNSHMLVLRTLELLRVLSPAYLRRFMAHADTLLWLDQAGSLLKPPPAGKGRAAPRKR